VFGGVGAEVVRWRGRNAYVGKRSRCFSRSSFALACQSAFSGAGSADQVRPAMVESEACEGSTCAGTAPARMKDERKRMKAFGGRGICAAGAGAGPAGEGEAGSVSDEAPPGEVGNDVEDGEGGGGGVALRLWDARFGFDSSAGGASKKKNVGAGTSASEGVAGSSLGSALGVESNVVKEELDGSFDSSNAPGVRFVANAIPGASAGSVHTSWLPSAPVRREPRLRSAGILLFKGWVRDRVLSTQQKVGVGAGAGIDPLLEGVVAVRRSSER
jgi:hypothetical protein